MGQILRLYTSETNPSKNLATQADFCISVYFSSCFQIKLQNSKSEGAQQHYAILDHVINFTDGTARSILV